MNGETQAVVHQRCPECGEPLVLITRYAVLAPRTEVLRSGLTSRVRYQPAWACRNGACRYHELVSPDR
jgi:hypothetical protein